MSADNWGICPRCKAENISEEKHEEQNFREDYEILVCQDGEFYISYQGRCTKCGLAHEFKHTQMLDIRRKK